VQLTTQILDVSTGRPAGGICVRLSRRGPGGWCPVGEVQTDGEGRVERWAVADLAAGAYRLAFDAGRFYSTLGVASSQSEVTISFVAWSGHDDHHVPVLLSPFGYTTYTGVAR